MSFYDIAYEKYFALCIIRKVSLQDYILQTLSLGTIINANVSQYDLNNPDFGTKENPIPIFMFDIPKYSNDPDFKKAQITDEQYRSTVEFYLSHIISKKEFENRFKKGIYYNNVYEEKPNRVIETKEEEEKKAIDVVSTDEINKCPACDTDLLKEDDECPECGLPFELMYFDK